MKKKLYIPALAFAAVLGLGSCSDILEGDNKSAGGQTAEAYFKTPAGLDAWRVNTFHALRAITTTTNIYENGTDLYWPSRGRGDDDFQRYNSLAAENGEVQKLYVSCFELVNNANGLIYFGGDKYKADALFLRSYGYYILTQQFGAVPYSTAYINDAKRDYPRAELKDIYEGCLADLQEAYNLAPAKGATNDGTVNKRAVAALAAKVALAAAWDLETTLTKAESGDYTVTGTNYAQQASSWAEIAIDGIALTQSFEQKWAPSNEDANPETFFSVQYDRASYPGTNGGHGLQNDFGSYYGDITQTFQKYVGSTKVPSRKSLYLWEEGDERYAGTFMTTFYNTKVGADGVWAKEGYYAYYNSDKKNDLPIAFLYAPYYTNKAAFEAQLTAMASRFQAGLANNPRAYIMADPVIVYKFDANGKWSVDNGDTGGGAYTDAILQSRLNFTPCVKKFDDPETEQSNMNSSQDYRDIVLLHASDIYLVAAEAYMLQDKTTECLSRINAVRERAHAKKINSIADYDPDFSTTTMRMVDLVLDERARELYAENQRWMDLRRTRQLVRYNVAYNNYVTEASQMANRAGEYKWYRPIPTLEINGNTSEGMTQNPGY